MSITTKTDSRSDAFLNRQTKDSDKFLEKLESQVAELDALVEEALREEVTVQDEAPEKPEAISIWGVPFSYLTHAETLQRIDRLIAYGEPGYFITANLNYNMLTDRNPELREVNENASFIVCDGMPMVWYSKVLGRPLPERVAGSELIYAINNWAAAKGHRVFFLGGAPGVAQAAADTLVARYPGLQVAGVESPPFRPLTDKEESELIDRVRGTNPDIIYVAFGQPKGELWIAKNCDKLGAPVCVQLGASFDFVAGGVARAPRWIQKCGIEWFYRMAQEPRRLAGRYCSNAMFLMKALLRDVFRRRQSGKTT